MTFVPSRVRGDIHMLPVAVTLLQVLVLAACSPQVSSSVEPVGATRFNGTWVSPTGEFKIWAADDQHLRVEFRGEHQYESSAGPMITVGTGEGRAAVEGDAAVFRPEGAEPDCAITLRLAGGRLEVSEAGTCGFGLNVTAAGSYRHTSDDRPQFGARERVCRNPCEVPGAAPVIAG